MLLLTNQVRPYAWGSPTVIPDLLGIPPTGEPQAELWLGAHPQGSSSVVVDGVQWSLNDLLAERGTELLGAEVVHEFGAVLPFLLKVLAIEAPLSLQVHPTIEQARDGYAREDARGIPLDAPQRLYRDRNHKPEMAYALSPVEALVGFRPVPDTLELLELLDCRELDPYYAALQVRDERWLHEVMVGLLGQIGVDRPGLVAAVDAACARLLEQETPFAPTLRAVRRIAAAYPADPGVVIALFMNFVELAPGEAFFVPAGMAHAYLSGTVIEPQATSDNTLRAGLTPKYVDAPELLAVLDVSDTPVHYVRPEAGAPGVQWYVPPVREFRLARIAPKGARADLPVDGPAILLCVEGETKVRSSAGDTVGLSRGQSVFVPAGDAPITVEGDGVVFAATTNLNA